MHTIAPPPQDICNLKTTPLQRQPLLRLAKPASLMQTCTINSACIYLEVVSMPPCSINAKTLPLYLTCSKHTEIWRFFSAQTTRSQHFVLLSICPSFLPSLTVTVRYGPGAMLDSIPGFGIRLAVKHSTKCYNSSPLTFLNQIKLMILNITRTLFTPFIIAFPSGIQKESSGEFVARILSVWETIQLSELPNHHLDMVCTNHILITLLPSLISTDFYCTNACGKKLY